MNLAQKVLDKLPDGLKIRLVKVDETEKWFLKITRKAIKKSANINPNRQEIKECEGIKREMEWILNNAYKDGRFHQYFSGKIELLSQYIRFLWGYD